MKKGIQDLWLYIILITYSILTVLYVIKYQRLWLNLSIYLIILIPIVVKYCFTIISKKEPKIITIQIIFYYLPILFCAIIGFVCYYNNHYYAMRNSFENQYFWFLYIKPWNSFRTNLAVLALIVTPFIKGAIQRKNKNIDLIIIILSLYFITALSLIQAFS